MVRSTRLRGRHCMLHRGFHIVCAHQSARWPTGKTHVYDLASKDMTMMNEPVVPIPHSNSLGEGTMKYSPGYTSPLAREGVCLASQGEQTAACSASRRSSNRTLTGRLKLSMSRKTAGGDRWLTKGHTYMLEGRKSNQRGRSSTHATHRP